MLNTVVPLGTPLSSRGTPLSSRGTPPEIARVFLTGETVQTDLFTGPVVQRPVLAAARGLNAAALAIEKGSPWRCRPSFFARHRRWPRP